MVLGRGVRWRRGTHSPQGCGVSRQRREAGGQRGVEGSCCGPHGDGAVGSRAEDLRLGDDRHGVALVEIRGDNHWEERGGERRVS